MSSAALLGLRIAPVILATSSLTFSFSEYHFYRPYLDLAPRTNQDVPSSTASGSSSDQDSNDSMQRAQVNSLLGDYINRQFPSGFATILTLYPLTWATAIANLKLGSSPKNTPYLTLPSISKKLYLAGLLFSVGHMVWGPKAKELMEEMGGLDGTGTRNGARNEKGRVGKEASNCRKRDVKGEKKDNLELLRSWLRLHVVRSVLADFPSWACFTAGLCFMIITKKGVVSC